VAEHVLGDLAGIRPGAVRSGSVMAGVAFMNVHAYVSCKIVIRFRRNPVTPDTLRVLGKIRFGSRQESWPRATRDGTAPAVRAWPPTTAPAGALPAGRGIASGLSGRRHCQPSFGITGYYGQPSPAAISAVSCGHIAATRITASGRSPRTLWRAGSASRSRS
jgi:hypothetical protein